MFPYLLARPLRKNTYHSNRYLWKDFVAKDAELWSAKVTACDEVANAAIELTRQQNGLIQACQSCSRYCRWKHWQTTDSNTVCPRPGERIVAGCQFRMSSWILLRLLRITPVAPYATPLAGRMAANQTCLLYLSERASQYAQQLKQMEPLLCFFEYRS